MVRVGALDARNTLISKQRSQMKDAREKLMKLAKTGDAREKLEKIRNLKQGKLEVKRRGSITFTTTTKGNLLLTTRKKADKEKVVTPSNSGITRRLGRGGAVSLTTSRGKKAASAEGITSRRTAAAAIPLKRALEAATIAKGPSRKRSASSAHKVKPLTRTIKGELSEAAKLDEELLNTHVDPVILKRTIKQSVRRHDSPPAKRYVPTRTLSPEHYYDRRRDRSRSPMDVDNRSSRMSSHQFGRRYNDFDDPRRVDDDVYRRRMLRQSDESMYDGPRTMGDRLEASGGLSSVSPLQGSKIVVTNLQPTVTEDDIRELFGDVGYLKSSRLVDQGTAEIVFVNKDDALRAVEIYHNRQLDGKAMRCRLVGLGGGGASSAGGVFRLSSNVKRERGGGSGGGGGGGAPAPEVSAIHRALFSEKPRGSGDGRGEGGGRGSSSVGKPLFSSVSKKNR